MLVRTLLLAAFLHAAAAAAAAGLRLAFVAQSKGAVIDTLLSPGTEVGRTVSIGFLKTPPLPGPLPMRVIGHHRCPSSPSPPKPPH